MIARNRFLPSLRLHSLAIFQQFPRVLVKEILLIRRNQKMTAPNQGASLQSEDALGFTANRASLGMRVIHVVSQVLKVVLFSPGIFISIFALPVHGSFMPGFVAFDSPVARPGEAFVLDVSALLGGFGRRERRRNCTVQRDHR